MKKFLCLALLVCFLSGCGLLMRPKSSTSQASDVSIYVYSKDAVDVLTFWRKINDDGSKGGRFTIKFAAPYKNGYERVVKLDPGVYYLDSFQIDYKGTFIVSQGGHFLTRNGWDDSQKQPKYLSFTVSENQNIILPKVEIIPTIDEKGKSAVFSFKLDSDENSEMITLGTLSDNQLN
jgi:hypothetical protein